MDLMVSDDPEIIGGWFHPPFNPPFIRLHFANKPAI